MPISALKKVETRKCEKGGRGIMVVKWEEDLEKSDWTQNLKLRVNYANVENGKMGLKNNGMTSPTPSSSLMDSRKHVKHLRSSSFQEEGCNYVIIKQEMGSNVRTLRTPGNSITSMHDDEKVNDSQIGDLAIGDPKSRNVCSFGNVYKGHKKLVVNTDPPHQKLPQVLRVNGNVVNCPSSSNILCFGGENAEELKNAGNEEYKGGHILETISFNNKAIALFPQNSPYHNNKAAALACLGCYAEAVEECFKEIDCDPLYSRAYHRLGNLYLSNLAIEVGADASYDVLVDKAEALLKLNKPKKSLEVLIAAKKLSGNKSR
ncbi:hypothetical protein GIB67_020149 [Kingdonia uniflora]|uniref:Uncharacterized protein n=1 Tax=Kingdonia uniflora TaxID=39325 RepID=A0A7J7NIT4_9MAGN|nr:hypothetical protein GIB67_020149 [Kingdonia uniflora]